MPEGPEIEVVVLDPVYSPEPFKRGLSILHRAFERGLLKLAQERSDEQCHTEPPGLH